MSTPYKTPKRMWMYRCEFSSISKKKLKKVLFLIKCLGMLGNMVIFAHLFFIAKLYVFVIYLDKLVKFANWSR